MATGTNGSTLHAELNRLANGGLVVGAVASVTANANVVASASAIYAGVVSINGISLVTANGVILGKN